MGRGKRIRQAQRAEGRQFEAWSERSTRRGWRIVDGKLEFDHEPRWVRQLAALKAAMTGGTDHN